MPPTRAAGRTHVGLVRKRNEDALYVGEHLFAVADGLGGHIAGDVASITAIDAIRGYDQVVNPEDLADTLGQHGQPLAADEQFAVRIAGEQHGCVLQRTLRGNGFAHAALCCSSQSVDSVLRSILPLGLRGNGPVRASMPCGTM